MPHTAFARRPKVHTSLFRIAAITALLGISTAVARAKEGADVKINGHLQLAPK